MTTEAGRRLLDGMVKDQCSPPCLSFCQAKWGPDIFADRLAAVEAEVRATADAEIARLRAESEYLKQRCTDLAAYLTKSWRRV